METIATNSTELLSLVKQLGDELQAHKLMLTLAESCTGGLISQLITSISGCSAYFERAFITYSNDSKMELLGVKSDTLKQFGAVSAETAIEMAEGALSHSHADISVSITGVAGPSGGTKSKPIGTVCFGIARKNNLPLAKVKHFSGDRDDVRLASARFVITELLQIISD
jgi:nicotinamide-nucleotide amidase